MLGYIAYILICAFGPIQLFSMIRGRDFDLGHFPVATLIAGLSLLQYQLMADGAQTYLIVGNGTALGFNLLNIAWILGYAAYERRQLERRLRETRVGLTPAGFRATDYVVDSEGRGSHLTVDAVAEAERMIDRGRGDN